MLHFGVFSRGFRVGWRGKAQRVGSGAALCVKAVKLNAAVSSMSDESAFKRKGAASLSISLARLPRQPLWCTARSATLHSQEASNSERTPNRTSESNAEDGVIRLTDFEVIFGFSPRKARKLHSQARKIMNLQCLAD